MPGGQEDEAILVLRFRPFLASTQEFKRQSRTLFRQLLLICRRIFLLSSSPGFLISSSIYLRSKRRPCLLSGLRRVSRSSSRRAIKLSSSINSAFYDNCRILARSLANFYRQYADRHMNLKFVRRVREREREIGPFVIVNFTIRYRLVDPQLL